MRLLILPYVCPQALDPENFRRRALSLRETHYCHEKQGSQSEFLVVTCPRGLLGLEEEQFSPEERVIFERIKERLKDPFKIMYDASNSARTPEAEPLAVVCHGDFLRNNMLFHYDSNGNANDVRFFDFQTSRYTTPAFDLALYLFMNTLSEVRRACWDDIWTTYHQILSSTIRRLAGPTAEVPSLDAIKDDFAKNALSGYVICSFFLPIMAAPPNKELFEEERAADPAEAGARLLLVGGEEATARLKEIILDCIKYKLV